MQLNTTDHSNGADTSVATEATKAQTVVLCMVVRNHRDVVERSLASLRPLIDAWFVLDAGSTDGTPEAVRVALAGLPGAVRAFESNDEGNLRTKALSMARRMGDYSLLVEPGCGAILDEDFDPRRFRAGLHADHYEAWVSIDGETAGIRSVLLASSLQFKFLGVADPMLLARSGSASPVFTSSFTLAGVASTEVVDQWGALSRAKLIDEALALEENEELRRRYRFAAGLAYRDAAYFETSAERFHERLQMGWGGDALMRCHLELGHMAGHLGQGPEMRLDHYLRAYDADSTRAEGLYYAARLCREAGRTPSAYLFARMGLSLPRPERAAYLEPRVYDWALWYEFSIVAWYRAKYREGLRACRELLDRSDVPDPERASTEANLKLYLRAVGADAAAPR